MTNEDQAAEILGQLRIRPYKLEGLSGELRPVDTNAAYDIQDRLHEYLAKTGFGTRIGYKIGCTTPVMQQFMDIDHPCAGGLFSARIFGNPAKLAYADFASVGVECEIAVALGADLDARNGAISRDQAAGAVIALLPAIEIVDNRYRDIMTIGTPTLIADDFCQSAAVLGAPNADWKGLDLAEIKGRTIINGAEVGHGRGADVLGHPLDALIWLANHLATRGRGLLAGEIVLLGSLVQCQWLRPGDKAEIQIDGLGNASAEFTA
ncbi:MAG: fumarylacetoacetate hydrolase family protein [Rhodospirillales bacterium]|nr:fumarylacetoacetate hydrolase family protein [Rhodospirillales bacterium]